LEHVLIVARSVTHAQRMERALIQIGIRAQIFRAPMELRENRGCAYAVQITPEELPAAMNAIRGTGIRPVQIVETRGSRYQEVLL
jgi:hypothetical protein